MPIPVAINGFGRIGRQIFRILQRERRGFRVVAINDLGAPEALAWLLRLDSTHGPFPGEVLQDGAGLVVDGEAIPLLQERDPAALPWAQHEGLLVVESTGVFRRRAQLEAHLRAGAWKVLLTVPPRDEVDALIVLGANDETLLPSHRIVSNASCTTNCIAPMAKILHESFGVRSGLMTTTHAYTNDQRILDLEHKDLRRARAAAMNIIPTTTGAARAVGKVLPALAGRLDGLAIRVPVSDGSLIDLTVIVETPVDGAAVNDAFRAAASGAYQGLVRYSEAPIVSSDVIGDPHSCIFDAPLTMAMRLEGEPPSALVKVFGWYDNEWGYSSRCADLLERMAEKV